MSIWLTAVIQYYEKQSDSRKEDILRLIFWGRKGLFMLPPLETGYHASTEPELCSTTQELQPVQYTLELGTSSSIYPADI